MTNLNCIQRGILCFAALYFFAADSVYSEVDKGGGTNDAGTQQSAPKRDPFWPVGYMPEIIQRADPKKKEVVVPVISTNWNEAMKKIVINGVSSRADNEFFAVINGQVKSVGDTVSLNYEGTIYTWAVDSINPPGSVKLRRVSAL